MRNAPRQIFGVIDCIFRNAGHVLSEAYRATGILPRLDQHAVSFHESLGQPRVGSMTEAMDVRTFFTTDSQSSRRGWRKMRRVGYHRLCSVPRSHRQSGAKGKSSQVGRPRAAARCAVELSMAMTKSIAATWAAKR